MAFSDQQVRKLRSRLKPQHVRLREAEGQTLHYLEGWHVMAEANRIFGFDGWDRETVSSTCVWTKQLGSRFCAAYVARVRITVRAGDERIIREGSGAGESNELTPGQAHDRASKAAETDATKRALTTFGNCFGLTLYSGGLPQAPTRQVLSPATAHGKDHGLEKQSRVAAISSSRMPDHQGQSKADVDAGGDVDGRNLVRLIEVDGNQPEGGPRYQDNGSEPRGCVGTPDHTNGSEPDGSAVVGPAWGAPGSHDGTHLAAAEGVIGVQIGEASDVDLTRAGAAKADYNRHQVQHALPSSNQAQAGETDTDIWEQPKRTTIDKSTLTISEPRRVRDPEHLEYVAEQPCMICGRQPCEAHHLRYVQPRALGRKSSDAYTVPLCALHHRELHGRGNERACVWKDRIANPDSDCVGDRRGRFSIA